MAFSIMKPPRRETVSMPPVNVHAWIVTAMVASIAAVVSGVHAGQAWLSWASVLMFGLVLVATAVDLNDVWISAPAEAVVGDAPMVAARQNAELISLAYLWGTMAMGAIYQLTDLRWQHGLQYATGMAVIGLVFHVYAYLISQPGHALRSPKALGLAALLVLLHGVAALVGVGFLLLSGKLVSVKGDWAANQIFLAGGLSVAVLSALAWRSQVKLNGALRPPSGPWSDCA